MTTFTSPRPIPLSLGASVLLGEHIDRKRLTSMHTQATANLGQAHLFTSAHSVLLMPNSLMKPSASSTPQSADCA